MEWFRQVQFVAAVEMPPGAVHAYGTTVNGMWADPEKRPAEQVAEDHRRGMRVLFSVPVIALIPRVYEEEQTAYLLEEVCRDVDGGAAECDWYFWEPKPVYAGCIYSEPFRRYLMERCVDGVDRGMDVVNLDEIMTSVGLMNRSKGGSGFCYRCLDRFRRHLVEQTGPSRDAATLDDEGLRQRLSVDDGLYEEYRRFHELAAYRVMTAFIDELRSYAQSRPEFAVSANVAYLGSLVGSYGVLWGCMWGPQVDFILMENHYRVEPSSPHLLLPRGTFAPSYRLGYALTGAPTWICPSITVPRQLADEPRGVYHQLMFLEAYANAGRWGYNWWPGVDAETRLAATAPESLKDYIRFIGRHRELYDHAVPDNDLAVLYSERSVLADPSSHQAYLALAQALAEAGHQFDVVYCGDGRMAPERLDAEELRKYQTLVLVDARELGEEAVTSLESFARAGGRIVGFSPSRIDAGLVRSVDSELLTDFWRHYRAEDRRRIVAAIDAPDSASIGVSHPAVRVTRFRLGERQVLHLLVVAYDEATDASEAIADLTVRIPWSDGAKQPACTLLSLAGEEEVSGRLHAEVLEVAVPRLDPYALLVVAPRGYPGPDATDRTGLSQV